MRYQLKFTQKVFDLHFVGMWFFCNRHFGYGMDYDLDFRRGLFLVNLESEEELSFFMLHWGDKVSEID